MITLMRDQLRGAVATALASITTNVTEDHPGCWSIRCNDRFELTAMLDNEWFELRAPFVEDHLHGRAVPRCAWEILQRNNFLPGAAKLVSTSDGTVIRAALERPLDPGAAPDLTAQVSMAIDHLQQATRPHLLRARRAGTEGNASEVPNLAALCTEAGWQFNRRSGNQITVPLDTAHGHTQALLSGDGGLGATVDLLRAEPTLCASSRQAISMLLLQLGGMVRAVRPAVQTDSGRELVVLQAYLGMNPSAKDLDRILAAMSVAAGLCHREVTFLADEQISNRFLSVRGWSAAGQETL